MHTLPSDCVPVCGSIMVEPIMMYNCAVELMIQGYHESGKIHASIMLMMILTWWQSVQKDIDGEPLCHVLLRIFQSKVFELLLVKCKVPQTHDTADNAE